MDFQAYFDWWLNLTLSDIDFAIFSRLDVLSLTAVVVLLLKAKIGVIKAALFTPMCILGEHTMFATLQLDTCSYVATAVFVLISMFMGFYLIYYLLIRDRCGAI